MCWRYSLKRCKGMARPINVRDEAERVLARMQGRRTYRVSTPCKYGHQLRYASNVHCVECEEANRQEYVNRTRTGEMRKERFSNGEFYVKL